MPDKESTVGNNGAADTRQMIAPTSGKPGFADVMQQLVRIERSTQFRRANTLKKFLRFVVEETLQGREQTLGIARVASQVFGKGAEFKNCDDAIVRVNANRLRRALALHNATEGADNEIIISLKPGSYVPEIDFKTAQHKELAYKAAIRQRIEFYTRVASAEIHASTYGAIITALKSHPEDSDLLAEYAAFSCDAFGLGFEDHHGHLDKAEQAIEKARALTLPNDKSFSLEFCDGIVGLYQNDSARTTRCARSLLRTDGIGKEKPGLGHWLLALSTNAFEKTELPYIDYTNTLNYPGWIHHPRFLSFYQHGDYESALNSAISFAMPGFFWGHLERAAALAQLGLGKAASREMQHVVETNPRFKKNPKFFLSRYIPHSDTAEHVLEGLQKAGLR